MSYMLHVSRCHQRRLCCVHMHRCHLIRAPRCHYHHPPRPYPRRCRQHHSPRGRCWQPASLPPAGHHQSQSGACRPQRPLARCVQASRTNTAAPRCALSAAAQAGRTHVPAKGREEHTVCSRVLVRVCVCMVCVRVCVHQSEEYEQPHDDSRELMLHQRNVVRSAHAHRCG